jgi:uncharacterized membrane protein YgdD (TMEM256/DUF423 family)
MRSAEQGWFVAAAIAGFLAVLLGAFAAHGLKARLSADNLSIFETGVRYQMYHALALVGVAYAAQRWGGNLPTVAGAAFAVGILFFSGSLYVLSISGVKIFGAVAPIGGLAFLTGWVCIGLAALRTRG